MNLLIITPDYPDGKRNVFPFVKQLAEEIARTGHEIHIIAPYSLSHNKRLPQRSSTIKVGDGAITVYRPCYISFSNVKLFGRSVTDYFKSFAFKRALKSLRAKVDIVYGHFWDSAYIGYRYASRNHIPLFVASGESEIDFRCDDKYKKTFCDYVSGVICVSTKNMDESIQLGLTTKRKCVVIPNAINPNVFFQRDRETCRKQLNLPLDAFIVSFVGWFSNRKGSKRLSQAITMIKGKEPVYSIFIGEGEENPECPNILFKGSVSHDLIPVYLNAADIFVLPTLHEGCCNAIIEAMACGLPVISSNLPFNMDVLDESCSIMIDPNNISDLSQAICLLRDNPTLCKSLAQGALDKSRQLKIDQRAASVLKFIDERKK